MTAQDQTNQALQELACRVLREASSAKKWYEDRASGGMHVSRQPKMPPSVAQDVLWSARQLGLPADPDEVYEFLEDRRLKGLMD